MMFVFFCLRLSIFADNSAENIDTSPAQAQTGRVVSSSEAIHIIHPSKDAHLPNLASTFVYGSVCCEGKLFINNQPADVYPGGGFLCMINLSTGAFIITAELKTSDTNYFVSRKISVEPPYTLCPVSPLTIENVKPDINIEASPGEEIIVSCKGSPGMKAFFTLNNKKNMFPMVEQNGIYKGSYIMPSGSKIKKSKIFVSLINKKKKIKKTKLSEGYVSLFPVNYNFMVEVSSPNTVLRAGPSLSFEDKAAYIMFVPTGTYLQASGRRGNEFRIRLTNSRDAWISESDVKLLPKGLPLARTYAGSILITDYEKYTKISVPLTRRIPFEIVPDISGNIIDVNLFGAISNTDWIDYSSAPAKIQLKWYQQDSETYKMRIQNESGFWGYDARYEGTEFVIELRKAPVLESTSTLKGIKVAVDAGHSSDAGAVGTTGYLEKDANLELAYAVRDRLLAEGAEVFMVRKGTESVGLLDRPKIAWQARADLLVSIHNNALSEAKNPLIKNGYGVYYYHPVSFALAQEILNAYTEKIGVGNPSGPMLRNDGLYYGNLALPRTTQMPSVLTESAYMIVPKEEALLKTREFRVLCADAITIGIKRYLKRRCLRNNF